jgi:hypothetical protein
VKKFIQRAARYAPLALALAMLCSNPVKDVKWRTSVDLPITAQTKFVIGAQMDTLFFNKKQVLTTTTYDTIKRAGQPDSIYTANIDTTMKIIKAYPALDTIKRAGKPDSIVTRPDTVAFGFPARDTVSDTISEDSAADKYFEDAFGPIPLSGAPSNSVTIPLGGNYVAGTPIASPLPVSDTIQYVYQVWFDPAQTLNLTVTNNSSADFDSVQVTLGTVPPSTATIHSLTHGTNGTAQFDVSSKEIDHVINVSVTVTPAASGSSGTFDPTKDNIGASFSVNGLKASKVIVDDYLLAGYKRTFSNEYNLTDTVNVSYIDIDDGFFVYGITNHTGLDFQLSVVHHGLWVSSFCIRNKLITSQDLAALPAVDSAPKSGDYNGNIISSVTVYHDSGAETFKSQNISKNRLFPEWDSTTKKSVSIVDYNISMGTPHHDTVTLSESDSLSFVIQTVSFKFKEMYGHSMEQYYRVSTPSRIPVKLPWNQAVTDSLRGNFKLQKVIAMSTTKINIPDSAYIDTIMLHYALSSVTHPGIATSSDVQLLHVTKDSTYFRPIDITNVVNDYPDSVQVDVSMTIPKYTQLRVENDLTDPNDPSYSRYIGRMTLHGLVNYNLMAPLCWTVVDTTIMDLGGAKIDLSPGSGVVDPIGAMTDKHGSLNAQVTNSTNLYLRLYALAATADSLQADSLTDTTYVGKNTRYVNPNELTDLINHPTPGFVDLLGATGLLVPPRDSNKVVLNAIALTDTNLSQLLRAKTIGLRWQVRFIPQSANGVVDTTTADALYNTDWIKVNSWIHVDGINCVDSLFKK